MFLFMQTFLIYPLSSYRKGLISLWLNGNHLFSEPNLTFICSPGSLKHIFNFVANWTNPIWYFASSPTGPNHSGCAPWTWLFPPLWLNSSLSLSFFSSSTLSFSLFFTPKSIHQNWYDPNFKSLYQECVDHPCPNKWKIKRSKLCWSDMWKCQKLKN